MSSDDPPIWRVDAARWAEVPPRLVRNTRRKQPGRPRLADRPMCDGLRWLACHGGQGATLPRAGGATSTVHARCQAWVAHGCCTHAWARLLAVDAAEVTLDWPWQAADGCLVQAPRGNQGGPVRRQRPGPTPRTGARPSGRPASHGTA